jgi:hypothetical protein
MMFRKSKAFVEGAVPLLTQLAALVLLGLVFYLGVRSERTGFVREVIDPGFRKLRDPVLNVFRAKPPRVDLIRLELPPASFDSLHALSESALKARMALAADNASLAGTLHLHDREIPVVVGLREGAAPPGRMRMWPLHVRALPGDTIMDMQTFDVLPIVDDTPLWSMLLHAMLKEAGHASLGSAIAEVKLNGKNMGLCMLQGRPDATMLSRWSRGSGPVLRFDGSLMLDGRALMEQRVFPSDPPAQVDWLSAPLMLQTTEGSRLSKRAQNAIRHMEAFRSGQVPAAEVFDTDHVARLLALCELLGTRSAVDWWNLRFLVDSISEELVPIPLHIQDHAPIGALLVEEARNVAAPGREITERLLADPIIRGAYIAYLDTFSSPGWWEERSERTEPVLVRARHIVNAHHPEIDLDARIIAHDRTVIHQALHPRTLVLAYIRDTRSSVDGIAVTNVHTIPVELTAVVWSEGDTTTFGTPLQLAPRSRDKPLAYTLIPLHDHQASPGPVEVLVRIGPTLELHGVPIRTWSTFGAN